MTFGGFLVSCVPTVKLLSLTLAVFVAAPTLVGLTGCRSGMDEEASVPLLSKIQKRGKIIAGVKYDSKPFGYLDAQGNLQGYDVDLMREIAKRILGDPDAIEFQQVLSSTRLIALDTGHVDVVAATMTITPEREQVIDFSDSYYTAGQAVVVHRSSDIDSVEDLQNKRILFVLGTTSENTIRAALEEAKFIGFKTSTDAFSALKAKRGDALTSDDTILTGFISGDCNFKMLQNRLSTEPYGLGFRQDNTYNTTGTFRTKVNDILKEMEEDGTLEALRTKWMSLEADGANCNKS